MQNANVGDVWQIALEIISKATTASAPTRNRSLHVNAYLPKCECLKRSVGPVKKLTLHISRRGLFLGQTLIFPGPSAGVVQQAGSIHACPTSYLVDVFFVQPSNPIQSRCCSRLRGTHGLRTGDKKAETPGSQKKRQTGNREFVVNWALTQNQSEVAKMRTICSATRSEKSSCKSDNSKADGGFVEIMNVVNEQQKVEMV